MKEGSISLMRHQLVTTTLHVFVKRDSATTSQTQKFIWQNMTSTDLIGQLAKVRLTVDLF